MLINDFVFRGDIETDEVLTALCAGFAEPPDKCQILLEEIRKKKGFFDEEKSNMKMKIIIGALTGFCMVLVTILMFYSK